MQEQDRLRPDDHEHEGQPGLSAVADDVKALLASLTDEIAATRRRYDEALAQIESRIGDIERSAGPGRAAATQRAAGSDPSEPWDAETAEALARAYEGEDGHDAAAGDDHAPAGDARLADLPQRIMAALADMRPQNTIAALEDRFGSFEAHIASAVADIANRSDVDGLHLVEAHLGELGGRLDHVENQLDKLSAMESALRTLSEQLSAERLGSILAGHQHVTADIETVARAVAEEMQARLAETISTRTEESDRQEELKSLIESSIREQRRGDDELNAVFSDLGGVVNRQVDRYDELHAMIDAAMGERRKGEEQMIGMLDTLQQALVQVLDRIDTLEAAPAHGMHAAPQAASFSAPATQSSAAPSAEISSDDIELPAPAASLPSAAAPLSQAPGLGVAHALSESDDHWQRPAPAPTHAAAIEPAAPAASAPTTAAKPDDEPAAETAAETLSPIERMRRELLADAQRARLKATSRTGADETSRATESPLRAPAASTTRPAPAGPNSTAALRATPVQTAPVPKGAPRKILGLSPKLLAAALAIVVAINGGLLLLSRSNETPPQQTPPAASSDAGTATEPGTQPAAPEKPRSDLGSNDAAELAAADAFTYETAYPDNVGATGSLPAGKAAAPHGVTVIEPNEPPAVEDQAMLYEQQVMADLSGDLGVRAANASLTDMLPEERGSHAPDVAGGNAAPGRVGMLDLPPATVGPLSLRLAAANGDASAQFEVGARLAEGKGTGQDFKEAMRWYQRSAAQGFAQAQYRLGTLFERGLGTDADVGRARVWYQRAAEQGNVKAMHNLAVLAAGPVQGSPDYVLAARWFGEAAESGLADSQYNLGVLYENGLGVTQDTERAFKWYSLAATAGDQEAVKRRDQLKVLLSGEELKAATELVSTFRAKPSEALANDPRAAGQDWQRRQSEAEGNDG